MLVRPSVFMPLLLLCLVPAKPAFALEQVVNCGDNTLQILSNYTPGVFPSMSYPVVFGNTEEAEALVQQLFGDESVQSFCARDTLRECINATSYWSTHDGRPVAGRAAFSGTFGPTGPQPQIIRTEFKVVKGSSDVEIQVVHRTHVSSRGDYDVVKATAKLTGCTIAWDRLFQG